MLTLEHRTTLTADKSVRPPETHRKVLIWAIPHTDGGHRRGVLSSLPRPTGRSALTPEHRHHTPTADRSVRPPETRGGCSLLASLRQPGIAGGSASSSNAALPIASHNSRPACVSTACVSASRTKPSPASRRKSAHESHSDCSPAESAARSQPNRHPHSCADQRPPNRQKELNHPDRRPAPGGVPLGIAADQVSIFAGR